MEIYINWLAVILATTASMVIAGAWYAKFFADDWRKLTGVSAKDSAKVGKAPMLITLVANFITAVALAAAVSVGSTFLKSDSVWLALLIGFIAWLGFSATTLVQHNAFELKPKKLTFINNSYQLAIFLTMALVIFLLN